ncbi:MAG TPA: type II toxin-antitoxin system VapC family toxin [Bryobacteraceae bacterium]|nr:type II toxin-antitoxin system VapC family toxin [Bryobacteraceae bacterium]
MISHLDTQAMVWLSGGQVEKLPAAAQAAIEESDVVVSPMVLLELAYLYKIKRIVKPPLALLDELRHRIGLTVRDHSFAGVMHTALFEDWTRDPFDRVIVAHARSDGEARLVTSDSKIREHYSPAVW